MLTIPTQPQHLDSSNFSDENAKEQRREEAIRKLLEEHEQEAIKLYKAVMYKAIFLTHIFYRPSLM